jgi:hypothetical protein
VPRRVSLSLSLSLSLSPVSVNFFVACGNYAPAFLSLSLSLCGLRRPFSLHACERISFWVKERPLSIRIDFSRTLGIYMPEIKKSHVEGHLLFLCFFFVKKKKYFSMYKTLGVFMPEVMKSHVAGDLTNPDHFRLTHPNFENHRFQACPSPLPKRDPPPHSTRR